MLLDLQTMGENILALNSQNRKHFSTGSTLILSRASLAQAQQSLLSSNTQCSGQKSFQTYLSLLRTGEANLISISDNNWQGSRFSQFEDPAPPKTPLPPRPSPPPTAVLGLSQQSPPSWTRRMGRGWKVRSVHMLVHFCFCSFLSFFFLMWTIVEVFIESDAILSLFYHFCCFFLLDVRHVGL